MGFGHSELDQAPVGKPGLDFFRIKLRHYLSPKV
jgi:hypothetical protein